MTEETDLSEIPPPPGTEPSAPPLPPPPEIKPPLPPSQLTPQHDQQNWLSYYMSNGFNFSHPYSTYVHQQYWYQQHYPSKVQPPLPPGPPLPQNNGPRMPLPFGNKPIRFQLNGKRLPNANAMMNSSPNSGAAKKKRKRNRNNQMQQQNMLNVPPLPPPELNIPKPEPPPESMPPLPPNSPQGVQEEKPSEQQQQQQLNGGNPTDDWPQSLKDYVHNCYAKCKTTIDKNQVEIILKGKITAAYQSGQLHKDWSKEPLPNIYSESRQQEQQNVPKFSGQVKMVTGHLAQFQNQGAKRGLSAAMGARLGARLPGLRTRSKSRSKSRSPRRKSRSRSPKKRHSTSSSSSDESYVSLAKPKKGKLADRLGPQKKNNKSKKQKAKEKKVAFYQTFGQEVEENREVLEQRAARFSSARASNSSPIQRPSLGRLAPAEGETGNDLDWSDCHIVGLCQEVEKSFLRLTKAPEPCDVRPVEVLRKSLTNVKDRWRAKQDYFYACDQLKSIRQDLTVQGVRNEFTVEVYETHARIALEKGDHEEFNQCQTQLKALYSETGGSSRNEFVAYRILYCIFTKNTLDIMTIMKSLSKEEKADSCISFALKLRSAWGLGNFHRFFTLYANAPLMTGFLVDWFIERERKAYLKCILKSYRQTITVAFLKEELAFSSTEECVEFLEPFLLTFTDSSRTAVDCKLSMTALPNI